MQITTKGQVTIPVEIREKMGFLPHTEVEFVMKNGKVYLEKSEQAESSRARALVQHMRGKGNIRMSTDEILNLTRSRK